MKLIDVKKPTFSKKVFTGKFEHNGEITLVEFDTFENLIKYYIKAKHSCNEKFCN